MKIAPQALEKCNFAKKEIMAAMEAGLPRRDLSEGLVNKRFDVQWPAGELSRLGKKHGCEFVRKEGKKP